MVLESFLEETTLELCLERELKINQKKGRQRSLKKENRKMCKVTDA